MACVTLSKTMQVRLPARSPKSDVKKLLIFKYFSSYFLQESSQAKDKKGNKFVPFNREKNSFTKRGIMVAKEKKPEILLIRRR